MINLPHIRPLTDFVERLRARGEAEYPYFDPLDGGTDADMLFLFEKPGPMTSASKGSGFISRDNDDPTAEATFKFMELAGIPRKRTVTWNVVPGWNGTRKILEDELMAGVADTKRLLSLLPAIRVVVLVGKKAGRAKHLLDGRCPVHVSAHPSPLVKANYPDRWNAIPEVWATAAR